MEQGHDEPTDWELRLEVAKRAVRDSRERLRASLVSAAEAHDRTAATLQARGLVDRAAWHRRAAEADRRRADQVRAELEP